MSCRRLVWARLLALVLSAFWESGGSSPVVPSISDFTLWPQLKPGRRPPEPQEPPAGAQAGTCSPQSAEGSAQAQAVCVTLHLTQGHLPLISKAGGRGWPPDAVLCCPVSSRRLHHIWGSQQSRGEEMSSNSGEPRTGGSQPSLP